MREKENVFIHSDFVLKLENMSLVKEIKILHANFDTEEITMEIVNTDKMTFQSIIDKIKFLEMSNKFDIKTVDFVTNLITISFRDTSYSLNNKEIHLLKEQKYITAIKELRSRRNIGLQEAKNIVDNYRQKNNLS